MTVPSPSDDDLPPLHVDVPDDARELDADVLAYHRELREHARGERWRRPASGTRWGRVGVVPPLALAALLLVLVAASALSLLGPRTPRRPAPEGIAGSPTAVAGQVGGLVPAEKVEVGDRLRDVRALRPAVLAFVPPACRCPELLDSVYRQASEFRLRLWIVTTEPNRRDAQQVATEAGIVSSPTVLDPSGRLTARYANLGGPTFVLVHADGVIREILTDVRPADRLEPHLAPLTGSGAGG